MLADHQSVAVM